MLQDSGVSAIVFHVKDLGRSKAFYQDVLGLTLRDGGVSEPGAEPHFLVAEAGSVLLMFFKGDVAPGQTPIVVFGVNSGIEDIVDQLARQGVEIVLPVSEAPGGLTSDFLDPDGHMLSLYQSVPAENNHGEG